MPSAVTTPQGSGAPLHSQRFVLGFVTH